MSTYQVGCVVLGMLVSFWIGSGIMTIYAVRNEARLKDRIADLENGIRIHTDVVGDQGRRIYQLEKASEDLKCKAWSMGCDLYDNSDQGSWEEHVGIQLKKACDTLDKATETK